MRDHAPITEDQSQWVHVASAARKVVEATASRALSLNSESPAMSGLAPITSRQSKPNGAKPAARIVLPWPDKKLTPHAKGHWASKAKATKAARDTAFWLAKAAGVQRDPEAVLRITYCPPDRQKRDCQNMHGRLKAAIDGIADAMGCDDNGFRVQFPDRFADPCKGGAVIVEINPTFGECIP